MDLKLDAVQVQKLITTGFKSETGFFVVEDLRPGYARVRMPFNKWMLRPGGVISGPALFTTADLAMYTLVLGHIGPELMAVTSSLNLNFLSRGLAADVHAEASLLKLGAKLAVMDVKLRCGDDPVLVAHATGSYSLPTKKA